MQYKLTEEILKLSESKEWETAKLEWSFETAYENENQTCLCGHHPITRICVIKNKSNSKSTEVGNCCINKFLGIDAGNKIFDSIKRLKSDLTKSMSEEVIHYLKDKNILNDFEYAFYRDIFKKKILSVKQLEIKKRINQKLLDFTSHGANSQFERINRVLHWAKDKPEFDSTFINSLKENYQKTGKLTEKQGVALESIMKKWRIE